ncbi:single-stranded DNA-binding protein [uncultured Parolsenella sp.]|uniref:single-stranded DNA-binding protein n=1 Tax=uncultured Parolsenella sp. TaxID=2083008 RepID=UPI0027D934FB|nr:single-stranded DNA-binding protein [uncultured Parolsenella sp.]
MSINRVNITGNLTRDPELRATQGGTQVLHLGVAVNDRRRNQQTGNWEDYPNFIDCVMFGTRAEAISRYLRKGTKVAIEGKLRYSSWERDGQKRSKIEVVVDEIEFMSSRADGGQQAGGYAPQGGYAASAPAPQVAPAPQQQAPYQAAAPAPAPVAAPPAADVYDEDIPF